MNGDQKIASAEKLDISHIESSGIDGDADRLRDLGYKQEFQRSLGSILQIAFPFTAMGVLPNWLVGFGPSLASGGPMTTPFTMAVCLCMAELYSTYPLSGGIYSWCYLLTSKKWGPFMAFVSGYIYLAALLTANMTVAWNLAQLIIGIVSVVRDETIDSTGAYVGIYILMVLICTVCGFGGMKFTNFLNFFMAFWLFANTFVFGIGVPCLAPKSNNASWVFSQFTNETGFGNPALVFFLGLLQAGWTMVGFDSGITISESTKDADKKGPQGLILCVVLALVQGIALTIAVLFSIQDLDALINSDMPIADFFMQVTNSRQISAFFLSVMVIAQFGSLSNTAVAFTSIAWSMARDGALPYSKYFYKLHNEVPLRLVALQFVVMVIFILPVFGTMVYWEAVLSTGVITYNIAYAMPFACRLAWSRKTMPTGPFSLGRWSLPLNAVALLWISFLSVILCFPSINPVDATSMNYSALMLGAVFIFTTLYFAVSGHKYYKGPRTTVDDDDEGFAA
ncbi:amino acid transporter [Hesseltinella vesiculosa]|uniref:Amino acid transporter n=1 Tax=Hesseltinella vesiculosa TaxID=101127 RepID=A0A1X2G7X0_9FUNG|nr:amino acid transporter [Hesseltinella vesiculosa]